MVTKESLKTSLDLRNYLNFNRMMGSIDWIGRMGRLKNWRFYGKM
jgi:hypothetical protein